MKQPLLITKTPLGKRIRMIDDAELRSMVEDDEVEHVKGNVYMTKVMVPQSHYVPRKPERMPIYAPARDEEEQHAEQDQPKRKRGRPPKLKG